MPESRKAFSIIQHHSAGVTLGDKSYSPETKRIRADACGCARLRGRTRGKASGRF